MADIVTGTVSGMVDTAGIVRDIADVRRETALEAGDVRRDVVNEGRHMANEIHTASDVGQRDASFNAALGARDASAYYIADVQVATQNAKESARSQAWTEAKIDSGFIKVAGDTALASQIVQGSIALQAEMTRGQNALQHGVLSLQIATQGAETRALMQADVIADLRSKSEERYMKLVELEGDRKHCDRDYDRLAQSIQHSQFQAFSTQLQMMNSDLQNTRQAVNNFGSGTATGGAISSNHA